MSQINFLGVVTFSSVLCPQGSYQHHKELKAAQGIKITAQVFQISLTSSCYSRILKRTGLIAISVCYHFSSCCVVWWLMDCCLIVFRDMESCRKGDHSSADIVEVCSSGAEIVAGANQGACYLACRVWRTQ